MVDDDGTILTVFTEQLKHLYDIKAAANPKEGLIALRDEGPFAVVVADMQMPGIGGVEFLIRCLKHCPDSIRILITALEDVRAVAHAINRARISRLLLKPISSAHLDAELLMAVREHERLKAESEIVFAAISSGVKLLTSVLSMTRPAAHLLANQARVVVKRVALQMGIADTWAVELAALLSQTGCLSIPEEVTAKLERGGKMTPQDREIFATHPEIGYRLVKYMPRMEEIAEIIRYQGKRFDGSGSPHNDVKGENIPLGARILHAVFDYNILLANGFKREDTLGHLRDRQGRYDPKVINALEKATDPTSRSVARELSVDELTCDMKLDQDITTTSGVHIASIGEPVTPELVSRLRDLVKAHEFSGTITVDIPIEQLA